MTDTNPADTDRSGSAARNAVGSSSIVGMRIGGDFEIRRKIGQGGMGTVYEAWQESLKRVVAIKVLGASLGLGTGAVVRFQREAQAAAKLHHTNIVPIFAQGEHEGLYFYVMELVEGRSLNELISDLRGDQRSSSMDLTETKLVVGSDDRRNAELAPDPDPSGRTSAGDSSSPTGSSASSLSESTAATFDEIAEQMAAAADALQYAHAHGVIHRDIKPHNFLYGDDGRLRIADFGLARVLEQPGVTVTGEFIGSPLYMSPEQITGGQVQVGPRTDIYSLGATMYEWLTLQPPFPGDTREQVISKIITTEVVPPRALSLKIPVDLETICLKALEKSPNRRYQTAVAMADDLRRFRRNEAIRAKREGITGRFGKFIDRNRVAVLAAGVVLALASLMWSVQSHFQRSKTDAVIAEKEQLAERVETLEEEKRRFTEEMGDLPLERSVADFGAKMLGDVAGAVADSGLFKLPEPLAPQPTPVFPTSTTDAIVLTQQDLSLIATLADEFTSAVRTATSNRLTIGRPDNPTGRIATDYFREALAAATPEQALALVNLTLQNEFDHFGALHLRSILYLRLSEFDKAIQDADMMINFREDSVAGHQMRGLVKYFMGDLEGSLQDLDQAIQLDPRTAVVWVTRGAVRLRAGQYLAAFDDFDRALDLSPGYAIALRERDQADVRIRYSVKQASDGIQQTPDDYELLIRRGDLHYLLGEYNEAMDDYRKALSVNDVPTPYLIEKLWRTRKKLNEPDRTKSRAKAQSAVYPRDRSAAGFDAPARRPMTLRLIRGSLP